MTKSQGFTLLELLIVVAVVALLAAMAVVQLRDALLRSKVARAKSELQAMTVALSSYYADHDVFPPAYSFCAPLMQSKYDYFTTPPELTSPIAYYGTRPQDPFNPDCTYKYVAPGLGWGNNSPGYVSIWVPKDFPQDSGEMIAYNQPGTSPVDYGIWSVGPTGPLDSLASGWLYVPVPRRTWYDPTNGLRSEGVIARLSTGEASP